MSTFRNVELHRSDDHDRFYAIRAHRDPYEWDKYVDLLMYSDCTFSRNYQSRTMTVKHHPTGNVYVSTPGFDNFGE